MAVLRFPRSPRSPNCRDSWRSASRCRWAVPDPSRHLNGRPERRQEVPMNDTASILVPPEWLDPRRALADVDVPGATVFRRGKVRTVYHADDSHFVIVA